MGWRMHNCLQVLGVEVAWFCGVDFTFTVLEMRFMLVAELLATQGQRQYNLSALQVIVHAGPDILHVAVKDRTWLSLLLHVEWENRWNIKQTLTNLQTCVTNHSVLASGAQGARSPMHVEDSRCA